MTDLLAKFRLPAYTVSVPKPRIDEVFGKTSTAYDVSQLYTGLGDGARGDRRRGIPVGASKDLARVLELPRRARPTEAEGAFLVNQLTARLQKPPGGACTCRSVYRRPCADRLRPIQAWALDEAEDNEGLLGPIGVGDGKTLLNLLTPMVMPGCKTALLLLPPDLRGQLLEIDWGFYSQHWNLPNLTTGGWSVPGRPWLHVVAFSELSGAKATDLLDRINPDLIIVDEAHNLRRRDAARTKRFAHFMHAHPSTRLCAWSGTLTSKSLKDYAMLSNFALKEASPTPLLWPVVEEWAGALDPANDFPTPIGKLAAFCHPGEHIHAGWKRRFHSAPGVVSSAETSNCMASLIFSERKATAPVEVMDAIVQLRGSWRRPDGEELVSGLDVARCARELASGFFYRWVWPRGEAPEVIRKWLEVRAAWHKELREKLKNSRQHLDSPLLCTKAAIRFSAGYRTGVDGPLPTWNSEHWPEWLKVRDTAQPETDTVWVSDYLVKDSAAWLKSNVGLVWYEHAAFGERVAAESGAPFYGPGEEASAALIREMGERACVVSIRSHHKGKNLQMFSRQLVANPPSDGATWEQLVGRTHRPGQEADEVRVEVYRHTDEMREALDKARLLAAYIDGTIGGAKKMLQATYEFL